MRDFGARARAWPRTASKATLAWAGGRYRQVRSRYGPRYLQVMLMAGFVSLFVPLPGSTVIAVTSIVAVAEIHLAISRWRNGATNTHRLGLERTTPSGEKS